ncbi:MAG: glycine cleavage system protein GcvH [Chloroflexi bacterium]|nr:glycine cleavage system protein GcvH [Chloroflexota bacterium]
MDVPEDLRYSDDHEWLRLDGEQGVVGITAYAADQLGDVVFVELPAAGTALAPRQTFGVVESVKAVSDLYAPVAGEVEEVNEALVERPELVNSDPYGEGWMLKLRLTDPSAAANLRDASSYRELTEAG